MTVAQDCQKSYANLKRQHKEFSVENHVYLRFKPKKRSLKLGSYTKLAPQFCGPFHILERNGPVVYKLVLPVHFNINNVFHVSLLKGYIHDSTQIIDWNVIQVEQ